MSAFPRSAPNLPSSTETIDGATYANRENRMRDLGYSTYSATSALKPCLQLTVMEDMMMHMMSAEVVTEAILDLQVDTLVVPGKTSNFNIDFYT